MDVITEYNNSYSLIPHRDVSRKIHNFFFKTIWEFKLLSGFDSLESAYSVVNLLSTTSGPLFKTHEAQDKNYTGSTVADEILPVFQ